MKKKNELERLKSKIAEKLNYLNLKGMIKKHSKIFILVAIILFLILGYAIGSPKDNKTAVLNKLELGLENGNLRTLDNIIRVNGKSVSKKELKPLVLYFKERKDKIPEFVSNVRSNKLSKIIELKKTEGMFRDSYYMDLKTFDLTVTSNLENTNITLDGKIIKADETIKGIIPGQYSLVGKVKTNYGEIEEDGQISILENTKVNLELKGEIIKLKSPFKDAKVLINGKDTGKTVETSKSLGVLPIDGSLALSIEKDFPWGKKVSDSVVLENKNEINLNIDMINNTLWSNIDETVDNFYTSVFKSLNDENKEEIVEATEEAKEKIYNILEKKYLFLKNDYKLNNIQIDKETSNFSEVNGKYRGTIVCDVNYEISKEIFGIIGISKTREDKKFFTNVIFENGKWLVENVENFSL